MITFKELNLNPEIMQSLDDLGFVEPSPVQAKSIPFILESKQDLIALAQTGTGKTAAYSLPILNQIKDKEKNLQAIILCPTRELCLQIFQDIKNFTKYRKDISVTAVYGGERIEWQIKSLKQGTNIVVGTPGRVHDLIRRKVLKLQTIKWLVLDEADEMLDMGFKDDLDTILSQTPDNRQTLLFSATMSKSVYSIAQKYMHEAEEISVGTKNAGADKVAHEYYVVQARDRFEALKRILDCLPDIYGIVFCRTRREAQEVADKLKRAHYDAEALHGEISQNLRTKIMTNFKNQQIRLLVATDVAARGIDVNNLSHVINYNLPDHNEAYTHRSGRTGRAQNSGISIALITPREVGRIRKIEQIINKRFEYKQIPSGPEVRQKQIDSLLAKIVDSQTTENLEQPYLIEAVEQLKKIKKEHLIKYFVANQLSHFIDDHNNNYNLNAPTKGINNSRGERLEKRARNDRDYSNQVNLKINFGKNHRFEVKNLFALINANRQLKSIEIGKIDLRSDYSFFAVDKKDQDEVIKHLDGTSFKGKKIIISKSNQSEQNNEVRAHGIHRPDKRQKRFGKKFNSQKRTIQKRSSQRRRS